MFTYQLKIGKSKYGKMLTILRNGKRVASISKNLRYCLPIIKDILSEVTDEKGIPMELHHKMGREKILPLDEGAFYKLALLFLLQKGINDVNRIKLLSYRINRFSKEEAHYWLSWLLYKGEAQKKWAQKGLQLMLCGSSQDEEEVQNMLLKIS